MSKSRVCHSQTINLAKKPPKKTNLLVYEKPSGTPVPIPNPCKHSVPPIVALPAKKIRVCTGAELKKMCPPPPCSCPRKKPPPGFLHMVGTLFKFGIKSAVAAGVLYWTYDQGLWGTSEESEEFYKNACETFLPMFCKPDLTPKKKKLRSSCEADLKMVPPPPAQMKVYSKECEKNFIDTQKTIYTVKQSWNHAVSSVFDKIVNFPSNVIALYKKLTKEKERECVEEPE